MDNSDIISKLQLAQSIIVDALNAIQAGGQDAHPPSVEMSPDEIASPASIPTPSLTLNPDGTITASAAENLTVVAWCYESQSGGWVSNGKGEKGQPYTFNKAILDAPRVKACYMNIGSSEEINATGADSILEL